MSRLPRAELGHSSSAIWFTTETPGWWTQDAACRTNPQLADLFTEARTFDEADVALRVCADCPVRAQCLVLGQELNADGVWGARLLRNGHLQERRYGRRSAPRLAPSPPVTAAPASLPRHLHVVTGPSIDDYAHEHRGEIE